jgi:hypothetical protein
MPTSETRMAMRTMKRGRKKLAQKCTDKFSAIVLSIIFFANVQGGEDEDPGGFGSLGDTEPGGIVVRPDVNFKEKSQRYNDTTMPTVFFLSYRMLCCNLEIRGAWRIKYGEKQ